MDTVEAGRLGGHITHQRHPNLAKELVQKRFQGKTPEEIKEYMRKVRQGKPIKEVLDK